MILIMLGTQNNNFKRLLEKIEELIQKRIIKQEIIAQIGYTKYNSENMKIINFMSQEELEKLQEKADIIITHGGVGSIISSIKKGKKVIAVPRLSKYKEHVNDHQVEIVQAFNQKKYIIGINEIDELEKALIEIEKFEPEKLEFNNKKMINIIEQFIDKI